MRKQYNFWPGALGYWAALFHLLVYGFGWSRPDLGLKWWYDTGKPTSDPRFALIHEIWEADGQLDWFAAWLWTAHVHQYLDRYFIEPAPGVRPDPQWLERVERDIRASGAPNPLFGGYDSLHLSGHVHGPMQRPKTKPHVTWPDHRGHVVLSVDSMVGWYWALLHIEEFSDYSDYIVGEGEGSEEGSGEAKSVEVVARRVGSLGIFHRSAVTQLWYSGSHQHHLAGN